MTSTLTKPQRLTADMDTEIPELPDEAAYDGVITVAAHEDMDDRTLRLHLNKRHLPINGVPQLPLDWSPYAEDFALWRAWHAARHRLAIPYGVVNGHVHASPKSARRPGAN